MAPMNTLLRYNESELVKTLDRLPSTRRTMFAAACAQRLFPVYARYRTKAGKCGPDALAEILARLWRDLTDQPMLAEELERSLVLCKELIPSDEEQLWLPERPAAQNAALAIAYALRCRKNCQAQEAAWAARMAYEALDNYVINQEEIDTNAPGAESKIVSHSLIQAELGRQQRELNELLKGKITPLQLRQRAIAESET